MERLRQSHRRFFDTVVPVSVDIERMGVMREPVLAYAGERPGAVAYRELCAEVLAKLTK